MEQPRKQLNPFAFPAETDVRFTLFVLAALFWIVAWVSTLSGSIDEILARNKFLMNAGFSANPVVTFVAIPLFLLSVALLLFTLYPGRLIRREKLVRFEPQSDANFSNALQAIETTAGLQSPPIIMLRKSNQLDGQVFGLPGQYVLRLDDGLRLALRKAPALFQAVVSHELAHIVNRDVARTYFAQALWTATLVCGVIPLLALVLLFQLVASYLAKDMDAAAWQKLFTVSIPGFLFFATPFLLGAGIVFLLRASLMRVRETYADWRAAIWGARQGLENILRSSPTAFNQNNLDWRTRIGGWLKLHPMPSERLGYLQDSARLFQVSLELPLFVGWLAAIIALGGFKVFLPLMQLVDGGTATLIAAMVPSHGASPFAVLFGYIIFMLGWLVAILPPLILAYLVLGSLGLNVFRQAVADVYLAKRGPRKYLGLLVPAFMMTVGLCLSTLTTPTLLVSKEYLGIYLALLPLLFLLLIPIWLCLCVARYMGIHLLAAHTGNHAPNWKRRLVTAYISTIIAILLLIFTFVQLAVPSFASAAAGDRAALLEGLGVNELLSVGGGFLCFWIFIFIVSVIGVSLWNRLRPRHCPQCGTRSEFAQVVGKQCANCHAELAAWAVVQ